VSTIDDCETADWTATNAPADALNAVTFKEGSNAIDLGKSGGGVTGSYTKAVTSTDMTNAHGGLWLYVTATTDFDSIEIRLGSSASDYFTITFTAAQLANGWNDLFTLSAIALQDWSVGAGSPAIAAIDFAGIYITTAGAGDTIASGRLIMDYWRGAIVDEYIEFDLTTAQAVTCGIIDGHDFDGTETDILLDSSTDAATWTNRATFTFVSGQAMVVFIDSVSARYWRIHFTKALSTESKEIGRVFLGVYTQPSRGYQLNWKRTLSDSSQTKRAFSGTQFADIRQKWWEWDFKIKCEAEATFAGVRTALSTLGIGTPLWIASEPVDNPNGPWTMYGRFSRPWSESEPINDVFDVSFNFAEDR
jgi:hypothetical protein